MALQFGSASSRSLLALVTFATSCAVWGCQVDERSLSLDTPGATGGGAGSDQTDAGSGSGSSTQGGAGGALGNSGSGSMGGSLAASGSGVGFGGSAGGGGAAQAGGAGRAGGTAGALNNPTSGAGGLTAGGQSSCGDIDQNGVDDCAETLVQNSRFDTDTSYWVLEPLSTNAWDSRNARSGTGSGSMLVSNVAPVDSSSGSFMVGGHQCLQVTGGTAYEVAARVLIPAGQGAGEVGINLQIFGADDCAGSFLKAETVASTEEVATWSVLRGEVTVPASARSIWLRLVVSKPFTQAALEALFDDVLVRQK